MGYERWTERLTLTLFVALLAVSGMAQTVPSFVDYVVGSQDVLTITSYDQADLSGKFTIEADGSFTFPLIGRFKAGARSVGRFFKYCLTMFHTGSPVAPSATGAQLATL